MKKILFNLFGLTLLLAGCTTNSGDLPKAEDPNEYMLEGHASMFHDVTKAQTRSHIVVESSTYLSRFKFYWDLNDKISCVFTQNVGGGDKSRTITNDYIFFKENPQYSQYVKSVDATNPTLCSFNYFFPGMNGSPTLAGKELLLNQTKTYTVQIFHGLLHVVTSSDLTGDKSYLKIDPTEYVEYTSDKFPIAGTKINFPIPLRGSAIVAAGQMMMVKTDHVDSLQVIEVTNASAKAIEQGTISFVASLENLWYYPKGSTFDPLTNTVTPGTGGDVTKANITNLAAGAKTYFMNWIVPKRTNDNLSYIDRAIAPIVPNGAGRKATSLDFEQTLPEAFKASAPMSEWLPNVKPVLPGMVY